MAHHQSWYRLSKLKCRRLSLAIRTASPSLLRLSKVSMLTNSLRMLSITNVYVLTIITLQLIGHPTSITSTSPQLIRSSRRKSKAQWPLSRTHLDPSFTAWKPSSPGYLKSQPWSAMDQISTTGTTVRLNCNKKVLRTNQTPLRNERVHRKAALKEVQLPSTCKTTNR